MSPLDLGPPRFAERASAFLCHHRALGFRYRGVEHILSVLGRYLATSGALDLDSGHYESWCRSRVTLHSNSRRKAEQTVRRFCLYRRRTEVTAFVPSADTFSRLRPYVRPVIVEPEQIERMLEVCDRLEASPRSPLRPAVARVATVLLYTSGLRSGEILRLKVEDIEDAGAVLNIRESKFHKSRLVPLSASAQIEVQRYIRRRAAITPAEQGAFLCNRYRDSVGPYSAPGFQALIGGVMEVADVRDREGRVPRIHDLRHSFAVQSLLQSYCSAGDPQALLPKLALYLGHASIESTTHYLKLVPAVSALASARFEAAFADRVLGGAR